MWLVLTTALASPVVLHTPVHERSGLYAPDRVTLRDPTGDRVLFLHEGMLAEATFTPALTVRAITGGAVPVAVGDVDGDGVDEVFCRVGQSTQALDVATGAVVGDYSRAGEDLRWVRDVDADGQVELVYTGTGRVSVYELSGLQLATAPRTPVGLAQLDADPELEIALVNGAVLDAVTLQQEPGMLPPLSGRLQFGDVDGDGIDAVLVTLGSSSLLIDHGTTQWISTAPAGTSDRAALVDVDGDGAAEAFVPAADGFAVLDGQSGQVLDRITTAPRLPNVRLTPLLADVDADGIDEVLGDELGIRFDLDAASLVEVDRVPPPGDTFSADLDGDGDTELVSFNGRQAYVLEVENGRLWLGEVPRGVDPGQTGFGDLDGDGADELLATGDDIRVYDWLPGAGFTLRDTMPTTLVLADPTVGDVDGDGIGELLTNGVVIDVLSGQSLHGSGGVPADLDGDGAAEILRSGLVYEGVDGTFVAVVPNPDHGVLALANHTVVLSRIGANRFDVQRFVRPDIWQTVFTFRAPGLVALEGWSTAARRVWYALPSGGMGGYGPADDSQVQIPSAPDTHRVLEVDGHVVFDHRRLSVWAVP
jgi:hypothetical protein